jgi:hypothetical protein
MSYSVNCGDRKSEKSKVDNIDDWFSMDATLYGIQGCCRTRLALLHPSSCTQHAAKAAAASAEPECRASLVSCDTMLLLLTKMHSQAAAAAATAESAHLLQ